MMNPYNFYFMNGGWGFTFLLVLVWTLFWKACALWIASRHNQKIWFIALLVINTVGILEIVYIFVIAKKKWHEVQEIINLKK